MHLLARTALLVVVLLGVARDYGANAFVNIGGNFPLQGVKFNRFLEARSCRHALQQVHGVRGIRSDIAVTLKTPLGIVFEEVEPGKPQGLVVADLVPGGNAEKDGRILIGDKLISTSAVVLDDSKKPLIGLGGSANTSWKREMIPVGKMDFSSIMSAIKSNTGRWGYDDCRVVVRRTDKSIPRSTTTIERKQEAAEDEKEASELPIRASKDSWDD